MNYNEICFVIIPFGNKPVGNRTVDFDNIYNAVFVPAIADTPLPEGGNLIPHRTDKDFFSADIGQEMFEYIEYARIALADISSLNANVFYELGVRHRAHQAGTAIFRQLDVGLPFDINHIKAFPYEYEPQEHLEKSKQMITQVLTETLTRNKLDSPVRIALMAQQRHSQNVDGLLLQAENAIRNSDWPQAIARYREAIRKNWENPTLHLALGLLLKNQNKWDEALSEFNQAVKFSPAYPDAYREKGIAENKLYYAQNASSDAPTGEEPLLKAVAMNGEDFDALASLGGVYKRQKKYDESLAMYKRATEISQGNTYPLLNEIKVQALRDGGLNISEQREFLLRRAERPLRAQIDNLPPYNAPWSFFDLSEIRLYLGDDSKFLQLLDEGILQCTAKWQAETHLSSLNLLLDAGLHLPAVEEGIKRLKNAVVLLP